MCQCTWPCVSVFLWCVGCVCARLHCCSVVCKGKWLMVLILCSRSMTSVTNVKVLSDAYCKKRNQEGRSKWHPKAKPQRVWASYYIRVKDWAEEGDCRGPNLSAEIPTLQLRPISWFRFVYVGAMILVFVRWDFHFLLPFSLFYSFSYI